ncbi:hypothetical protein Q8W71_12905 [Methylobacterium sp. NEAU 140]|uniref:hypothetical protein n=1 Tax=Methylobacterium sp. NEAU 140 TaxID=3064945 RepID=UPI002735DB01|nr:hypothetical protein [Methylobacterium sp. NEAU 140]MDP4023530.1 hypothetical protein [Methylobacterium sp. NEAU 140]
MAQIGTHGRIGPAQVSPVRAARPAADRSGDEPAAASRALTVVEGGRREAPRGPDRRAEAGFVAQLLAASDPTLRPSRLERTRRAADLYTETARRLA